MTAGLTSLMAAYVLSQFYRAFLAVMAPTLTQELGVTPADLAISSGLWFLSFALMQWPVGAALDKVGPRLTASLLLGLCGAGGAVVFALAQGPWALHVAMFLIGIGCAPVLMAAYYIFARVYSQKVFGLLAGFAVAAGSLGNIAGTTPLVWVNNLVGWRATMGGLGGLTLFVSLAIAVFMRDPDPVDHGRRQSGTMAEVLAIRALWPIVVMMLVVYAPSAAIRGLWLGPYLHSVFGTDSLGIGHAALVMGLAMVAGSFLLGPVDRLVGSLKWGIFGASALSALSLALIAAFPASGYWTATVLMAVQGFFGATYPALMSHGRRFLPPHLIGRGVSFINMFAIGGAGLLQFASRPVYQQASSLGDPADTFRLLFMFFLAPLLVGLAVYLFSRDDRV